MLRFAQFLTEKYYTTAHGFGGAIEIFKNPTIDELKSVSVLTGGLLYCAGLATEHDLFVWNREVGQHRDVIELQQTFRRALPLYLYYHPADKYLAVDWASYTMSTSRQTSMSNAVLMKAVRNHPAFQKFGKLIAWNEL